MWCYCETSNNNGSWRFILAEPPPIRKDGHHPIINKQFDPISYHSGEKKMAASMCVRHTVISRQTDFSVPDDLTEPSLQEIYRALAVDQRRSEMIVNNLLLLICAFYY
jgi:hypothetical protein